jgi:lysyl-tRNA synthetase class I
MAITSNLEKLEEKDLDGEKVAVGFRPSGSLHIGNLVTITYAAVLADELGLELDLMVCDTDWSAHIHEHHLPDENRVMKLFFNRECHCEKHANIAEHRVDEISVFLEVLKEDAVDFEPGYLSEYSSEQYTEALGNALNSMDNFDRIFGNRFRDRYRSPVAAVCLECGFSDAKGSAFSQDTGMLVSACHNPECDTGFMETELSEPEKGVYYLVDPVRDPAREVAVHVFGGDYRDAEKEQKTPKIEKVRKITKLACGESPEYFLAPIITDGDGRPLSKSNGTGVTVDEIDDLEEFSRGLVDRVRELITEEREYLKQDLVNQVS